MASSDIHRAARLAAERVEAMIIEMRKLGEVGEVAIKVTPKGFQPIKRVETELPTVHVKQGYSELESVG